MPSGKCPNCHSDLPKLAVFCPVCGISLAQAAPEPVETNQQFKCPQCGKQYTDSPPNYCVSCGFPLAARTSIKESATSSQEESFHPSPVPSDRTDQPSPDSRETVPPPLPPSSQPPIIPISKSRKPSFKLSKFNRRWIYLILVIAILGAAIWAIVTFWPPNGNGPKPLIEACQPVEPGEDFELANQNDLQGELPRDSYFKSGEEYTIAENAEFTVPEGVTLVIEPGARVRFGDSAKMVVKGNLSACGKKNRPILFTADTTTGSPGFWSGVVISNADSDTVIGHATFEFAGKGGHAPIWVEGTDVRLENVKFDSNQWYPISLDPDSTPRLRPPFEVENGPMGWEIRGGPMNESQIWTPEQNYVVQGVIDIKENASLTIQSATQIKFQSKSAIVVHGELTSVSESDQPIIFTSVNDTEEENAPEPAAGDWAGLYFSGRESQATLENVEVRYAGGDDKFPGCLYVSDANPVLKNVTVDQCAAYSLSTDINSQPEINGLTLTTREPTKRWEMRGSDLEGVTSRRLSLLLEADNKTPIYPVVTGWVGVPKDASFIIDPGVTLLFSGGDRTGLWADGKLAINGEPKKPVVLTSWRDSKSNPDGGAEPGDWGGLHTSNTSPEDINLKQLSINYAGAVENTCLLLKDASPTIDGLSISNCAGYPISSTAASNPLMTEVDLSDNQLADQWEIRGSSLTGRSTWEWEPINDEAKSPIIRMVTGLIQVEQEATLRLKPGLILKFTNEAGLRVIGSIQAEGEPTRPVILTSWRDPEGGGQDSGPQPGDWAGISMEGSQAAKLLNHIHLRYAGVPDRGIGCLNIINSNPSLSNLSISNCNYYPINSDLASDPKINGLLLTDNRPANEWAIKESTLENGLQRTWGLLQQADGSGEILRTATGWLSLEQGAQLTVQAGVVVKFESGKGLYTNGGTLVAEGNADLPVIFTSWRDPQFSQEGGVQAGDWGGLALDYVQSDTLLKFVEIRYAGGERNPRGAMTLTDAAPVYENLTISDSAWYPVSLDVKSNPQVKGITFSNNLTADAIEVRGSQLDTIGEQTWSPWYDTKDNPLVRVVINTITIGENSSLRLEPGTLIKFNPDAGLDVYGGLHASEAIFTSIYDDENGGDTDGGAQGDLAWKGISIYGRKPTRIEDSTIVYATTGVWLENAAPMLVDTHIRNSREAALSADILSELTATNLILDRNAINGVLMRVDALPSGEIHWQPIGTPEDQLVRVINKLLVVGQDTSLIIEAGVVVKFAPEGGLIIDGELQAGESGGDQIYFTAIADDSIAGDTDSLAQTPIRGSWLGIAVNPNNTNAQLSLFQVEISYATVGLLLSNMPEWNYEGLVISESQLHGLACDALSYFDPEDPNIILSNNGTETLSCPTSGG